MPMTSQACSFSNKVDASLLSSCFMNGHTTAVGGRRSVLGAKISFIPSGSPYVQDHAMKPLPPGYLPVDSSQTRCLRGHEISWF